MPGFAGEDTVSGDAGLLGRLVDTLRDFDAAAFGLLPIGFGMGAVVPGLRASAGLRVAGVLALAVLALAVLALGALALGALAWGFAALGLLALDALALGFAALGLLALGLLALGFAALGRAVLVLAAGRCLAVVRGLRPALLADEVRDVLALADAAAGLAADMVLAAVVSALDAALMALVAVFIAASALDMVLADAVALVAADVIFVAAEVTLAAADDTVLAAATCAVARGAAELVRVDVVRVAGRDRFVAAVFVAAVFVAAVFVVALDFGLVPARLTTALLRALDRAVFAAPRRAGLRAVGCRGIDLPP